MHPIPPQLFLYPRQHFLLSTFLCFKPIKLLVLKFYFSPKNKFDEM